MRLCLGAELLIARYASRVVGASRVSGKYLVRTFADSSTVLLMNS
jgi:hypothetical protein